jgi:arylsulfatase A-like enzyme
VVTRLAGVLALVLMAACGRDGRPDVVLIVLDTVRADHLTPYGYARETTPQLAAFARDAVVYRNAIAPDTWTASSHASLFTGLMPSTHGVRYVGAEHSESGVHALAADVPVLAERLREAGWKTAAFVGNDGFLDPVFGLARGFERYQRKDMLPAANLVSTVVPWLKRREGRPVFLFLNVMDAHEPYAAPPPYDRMFPGRGDGLPAKPVPGQTPDAATTAHWISQYDGELRYVDDRLAELFAALRETGRYDGALVVVTADHGELFGEHGRWGHGGAPVRELVHVPLIVKYPGNARRGVEARPVSLADVPATILSVLGLPPLAAEQPTLDDRRTPAVAEHLLFGTVTRASYDAGGERIEQLAVAPPARQGPVVFPVADRRLADRLRALGYVE